MTFEHLIKEHIHAVRSRNTRERRTRLRDLLRAPDAGGLSYWLGQLAGGATRTTVANGFVNSTENRTNQVTFFYRYFLNRTPDSLGLAYHIGRLQGGTDEARECIHVVNDNHSRRG